MRVINLSYLEESSQGNKEFIRDMIQIFLRQTPGFIKDLKETNGNWEEFRKTHHKFRPSIKIMGMEKGQELISQIENCYKSNSPGAEKKISGHLEELEEECKKASEELQSYLNELH